MSTAYQQAQIDMGIFSTQTVSVGDLFSRSHCPGTLAGVVLLCVHAGNGDLQA